MSEEKKRKVVYSDRRFLFPEDSRYHRGAYIDSVVSFDGEWLEAGLTICMGEGCQPVTIDCTIYENEEVIGSGPTVESAEFVALLEEFEKQAQAVRLAFCSALREYRGGGE